MKRVSVIFVVIAMVFLINSISTPKPGKNAVKKKDQNCLNRCAADNKLCIKKSKNKKYKARIADENECIRQRNTCIDLCPDTF
jgi:hypothetical protein